MTKVNRYVMPQIAGNELTDAINVLKRNNIGVKVVNVLPSELYHSQHQVDKEKVIRIAKEIRQGKPMPPIVISIDNYIVDGHHRQLAYKITQPTTPIKVIRIGLNQKAAIAVWKKVEHLIK